MTTKAAIEAAVKALEIARKDYKGALLLNPRKRWGDMAYILLGISLIMFLYAINGGSTVRYMAALLSVLLAFFAGMMI